MKISPITRGQARALRPAYEPTDEQGRTLLDLVPGSRYLGAFRGVELVGVLCLHPVDPDGVSNGGWWRAEGPHGEGGGALLASLAQQLVGQGGDRVWFEMPSPPPSPEGEYSASSIRILEGLAAIRARPAMYVGSADERGLGELLWEVVNNAIDEHLAGHTTRIELTERGGEWSVADDGRGVPAERTDDRGNSALESVFARMHFGDTWDGHRPHVHVGRHGLGLAVLTALCERVEVVVDRPAGRYRQRFGLGRPLSLLERLGEPQGRGTRVSFLPDPRIFGDRRLSVDAVRPKIQAIAALNPGLELALNGERFHAPEGLIELARADAPGAVVGELQIAGTHEDAQIAIAVVWTDCDAPGAERTWGNQLELTEGGSLLEGLRAGLRGTRAQGRVALASVMLSAPQFAGRTRTKLAVPAAREGALALLELAVRALLAERPDLAG